MNIVTEAKGQFGQMLVATLLEHAGYRVLRLGVEETVSEVKAGLARQEGSLNLPEQLRSVPDFLIVDVETGVARMVEVKFRRCFDDNTAMELGSTLSLQAKWWPEAVTVVITPNPPSGAGSQYQDYLRVIEPKDVGELRSFGNPGAKWQALRTLGSYFTRVHAVEAFHASADKLIDPIRGWKDV